MRWINFPSGSLTLFGLPFFRETAPKLLRLPERARAAVRPPVWDLARETSGARVCFLTDSANVAVRARYPQCEFMANMARTGQSGVDFYVAGRYRGTQAPLREPEVEFSYAIGGNAGAPRRVDLYLPLYAPVELLAVGVDDGAEVEPSPPYRPELPVVFYGSSITQGGCATRPGMSYPAILSRMLGLDFVNLGFSGNGKGEPEVAALVAEVAAGGFVLDWTVNCDSVEQAAERYLPFYRAIRARHPAVPVLMVTPLGFISQRYDAEKRAWNEGLREVIREAFTRARAEGDRRLLLVEGQTLLSPDDEEGFVDGVHPNDIGFLRMAERLRPALRAALGL